jgi:hypothetical protein
MEEYEGVDESTDRDEEELSDEQEYEEWLEGLDEEEGRQELDGWMNYADRVILADDVDYQDEEGG